MFGEATTKLMTPGWTLTHPARCRQPCYSSQTVAAVSKKKKNTSREKRHPLVRPDIAVKLHLTTSPQLCQQLASEVENRCWGKSSFLDCTEAMQERGSGWDLDQDCSQRRSWNLTQMTGLTFGGQSSQHGMGEDTPSSLKQPRGFKDREVDGLQLYGLLQQLLICSALYRGWHLINVPPVWRCCGGSWKQREDDRRVSGSADGRGGKMQLFCNSNCLLAFTGVEIHLLSLL